MYIITLMCNPSKPILTNDLVSKYCQTFEGISVTWLNDGVAADITVSEIPNEFKKYWLELQASKIDMVIQKEKYRKKRLLVADMDSTIIHQECIDELALEYGVGQEVSEITKRSMNGEITFESSLRERVKLLKGMKIDLIEKVLKEKITYMAGAEVLIKTMKYNGCYTALVSGGFTAFSKAVSDKLGFDESIANILLENNGILNGFVQEPILGESSKVDVLKAISSKLGIDFQDFIAVGDGANDIGMLELAGLGAVSYTHLTLPTILLV